MKIEKKDLEKLKISVFYETICEDEKYDDVEDIKYTAVTLELKRYEEFKKSVGESVLGGLTISGRAYYVVANVNHQCIDDFFEKIDDDFCLNLDVMVEKACVGNVAVNRIFVNDMESVCVWLDNEAPFSMNVGKVIKKDFNILTARYVGIIDELSIVNGEWNNDIKIMVMVMLTQFIECFVDRFKIYRLYTIPKLQGCVECSIDEELYRVCQDIGYEVVEKKYRVMANDVWDKERSRCRMEKLYL